VRQQAGSASEAGAADGVPVRPEGLGELTKDVLIRIGYVGTHAGPEAVLVVMRHDRDRGLLFRSVRLGRLELDFCKVPRLRIVR